MLNFDYLTPFAELAKLHSFCNEAEVNQLANPDVSALNARRPLEWLARGIYYLKNQQVGERASLLELLNGEPFTSFVGEPKLLMAVHYVRKAGNTAAHTGGLGTRESFFALLNLYNVVGACLVKLRIVPQVEPFRKDLVPGKAPVHVVAKPMADPEKEVTLKAPEPQLAHSPQPLQLLPTDLSEAETRRLFIDMMLKEAGWQLAGQDGLVAPGKACTEVPVAGMPNSAATGFADYVLFGPDGLPLAVVEAKRTTKDPIAGRHQAQLYAEGLERQYGTRPVIYCSNGYTTEVVDQLGYPHRNVVGFHSLPELLLLQQRRQRKPMAELRISDAIANREYQKRAIRTVCQRLNRLQRRSLLVMATGTGKTRVAIALADVLCRAGWVKNILFLADRTALVNQAARNFAKLLPQHTTCILSEEREPDMDARIMFSTYQTMIGKIDADQKDFTIGRFDLIIVDEAHRSVFGKYTSIFSYFDAFLVGLTATPRTEVERNTFDLFGTEADDAFAYELGEAVADHFLVPYATVKRQSRILSQGIKYAELDDDGRRAMEPVWRYEKAIKALNPNEEYTRDIGNKEIFSYIHNIDTIDLMLQDLMEAGLKVQGGDTIGKTIIFAHNHDHALLVLQRFAKLYPELGPDFCALIDNYVNYAQDLINRFERRGEMPQVVVSVDMMDTGIDVPDVLNLVFFKPVHSRIKFQQMIGRGTRLAPGIFGPGKDKQLFYIFDWCNNFEYFSVEENGKVAQPVVSLSERLFGLKADIAAELQAAAYQADPFARQLQGELKDDLFAQTERLHNGIIAVRENWQVVDKYRNRGAWTCLTALDVAELKETIAPLVPKVAGDEWAKRFDLMLFAIELSCLATEKKADKQKAKVADIAHQLQDKASIPQVMEKMELIEKAASPQFWQQPTLCQLEEVRNQLRDLIKFLLVPGKDFVVDIDDEVTEKGEAEVFAPTTYRQRVMDFLLLHRNLPVLKKITQIEQLTAADVLELERIMWQELGSRQDYDRYVADHQLACGSSVAAFIRAQVGIDRQVALERYSSFLSSHTLNAEQEEYLRTIINYVCQNGDITPATIVNSSPFNELDWQQTFGDDLMRVGQFVNTLHQAIIA